MGNKESLVMSDEKSLDLTDQFAIAALQSLVQGTGNEARKFAICNYYITGEWASIDKEDIEMMDRLAKVAYHMARAMRKARLGVFE